MLNSREILKITLQKHWRVYEAFLALIASMELVMMLYGYAVFDFSDKFRQLYYASYVALFSVTVVVLVLSRQLKEIDGNLDRVIYMVDVYIILLVFWSAWISAMDVTRMGHPVTFMTILAAVGSLVILHPALFLGVALTSTMFMIGMTMLFGFTGLHSGFFMNQFFFLLVVAAVGFRNYHVMREQYTLEQTLEGWAWKDALTGVANRRSLDQKVDKLLLEKERFTFILLDVDNFKTINDRFGHHEGDECLISLTKILSDTFGENVYRYGGDEFAIITTLEGPAAQKKLDQVNEKLRKRETEYLLQICAGIYACADEKEACRIFERADSALYTAKKGGKARAVIAAEQVQG